MATSVVGVLRALLTADTASFDDAMKRSADATNEWIRKFGDLGDTAKSVGDKIGDSLGDSVLKLASAFSISHLIDSAVSSIIDFGKSAFTSAEQAVDLSLKLGMSTDAIQKFGYVAAQGGSTTEAFANSAFKLGVSLEKGGSEVEKALSDLKLSRDTLLQMKPEDQLDRVARALGELTNVQQRNRDGVALMGKSYSENAAAFAQYAEKAGEATIVDADRLKALDETAKAYDRLKDSIQKGFTSAVGGSVLALEDARKQGKNWLEILAGLTDGTLAASVAAGRFADEQKRLNEELAKKAPGFGKDIDLPKEPITLYTNALAAAQNQIRALSADDKEQIDAALQLGAKMEDLAKKYHLSADAAKIYQSYTAELTKEQEKSQKQSEKAAAALKAQADALEKAGRAISVGGVLDAMKKMNDELAIAAKNGGLNQEALKKYGKQIDEWLTEGYKVSPALSDIHYQYVMLTAAQESAKESMKDILALTKDITPEFKKQGAEAEALAQAMNFFQEMTAKGAGSQKILQQMIHSGRSVTLTRPQLTFGQELKTSLGSAVPNMLGSVISSSITSGRAGAGQAALGVGQQVGDIFAGQIGKSVTKSMTSSITGVAGMGATIAGGVASMGISIGVQAGIAGVQALIKHNKNNTLAARKDFAQQIGFSDLGALYSDLQKLGDQGQKLADAGMHVVGKNDQAANEKWMSDVQKFYQSVQDKQKAVTDDVGKLQSALDAFGGSVPKSLQPMVEELEKMPGLSADMKSALMGMSQEPSWQVMQQKAEDLGVSLSALGPKFQESRLDDIALGYARDLQMFADAGADIPAVLSGMSDELSTLYQQAAAAGVALPESLQPYMEQLVRMGLLVDENGDKVQDLNAVAFKDIPDESLKAVVDILKEIKDLLADQLPKAADEGAKAIQSTFAHHPVTIPVQYDTSGSVPEGSHLQVVRDGSPAPEIGLAGGTHGAYVDWGSGTPVMLHGKEMVEPIGEVIPGPNTQPIEITVVSQLDGRAIARNQVRYIPRELTLGGV
jgi:hypothetical protein